MTALENQITKLSKRESQYFALLNIKGITGEEALNNVLIASATGLLK
jgi:hypothetical protein